MRTTTSTIALTAVSAVAAVGLTAGTAGGEPEGAGELEWSPCEGDLAGTGLECAAVEVPLDWERPSGETVDIALSRRTAADPDRREGVLLTNPGGPGASGRLTPAVAESLLGAEVVERFDIIGFDPRGTGASAGVACALPIATTVPADAAEYATLLEDRRQGAEACAEEHPHLGHVDTVSAARDIDVVREALGEEGISWYGWSYGTQLGATYAELYPGRVDAVVLDGMYDHTRPGADLVDEQSAARERAFERFAEWCDAAADCVPGVEGVAAAWDRLVEAADAEPLPADEASEAAPDRVDGDMVVDASAALLSSPANTWPMLGDAVEAGLAGDGSLFAEMVAESDMVGAMLAIRCADWPASPADRYFERVATRAAIGDRRYPRFGAHAHWYYAPECLEWPVEAGNPPRPHAFDREMPVLVVGGKWDPATPYEWSVSAAEDIPGASLLTYNGDGHGASVHSACVREQAALFLVDPGAGILAECG